MKDQWTLPLFNGAGYLHRGISDSLCRGDPDPGIAEDLVLHLHGLIVLVEYFHVISSVFRLWTT